MVRRTVDTTPVKLTCARLVAVDSQQGTSRNANPHGVSQRKLDTILCSVGGSVRCEMYGWDVGVTRGA